MAWHAAEIEARVEAIPLKTLALIRAAFWTKQPAVFCSFPLLFKEKFNYEAI